MGETGRKELAEEPRSHLTRARLLSRLTAIAAGSVLVSAVAMTSQPASGAISGRSLSQDVLGKGEAGRDTSPFTAAQEQYDNRALPNTVIPADQVGNRRVALQVVEFQATFGCCGRVACICLAPRFPRVAIAGLEKPDRKCCAGACHLYGARDLGFGPGDRAGDRPNLRATQLPALGRRCRRRRLDHRRCSGCPGCLARVLRGDGQQLYRLPGCRS